MREQWSQEDEDLLRDLYPRIPTRILAKQMNRSIPAIIAKASRMGIQKEIQDDMEFPDDFENPFELISREEAQKLDKIDVLRVNWSIFQMYQRELNNPSLTKSDRHKLMISLSNHTAVINSIMKGSEEELGDDKEDIRSLYQSLNLNAQPSEPVIGETIDVNDKCVDELPDGEPEVKGDGAKC